uniref:hypothetical protein n=1 Tax=Mycolicibacterium sp. CBMA 213 TaxID=1968788 RepID=UPI00155DC18E|nr:hypothetical protein [Mycolicibacterium sp. CBMA 213]
MVRLRNDLTGGDTIAECELTDTQKTTVPRWTAAHGDCLGYPRLLNAAATPTA